MLEFLPHMRLARKKEISRKVIDALAYTISIASLLFTIDQVRLAWSPETTGISIPAWTLYTASSFIWLIYGIIHNDRALIITNSLWVFMCGAVIVGAYAA